MVVILIVSLFFFSSWQAVGFLWGYYIQQFGATIIIVAAGFIVSCLVSNETTPFKLALFAGFNFTTRCVYNCNNQSYLHIFLNSSDIWTFMYSLGTIKVVWWYLILPSRLPTMIVNYCNSKRSPLSKLSDSKPVFSGERKSRGPEKKPLKQGENQPTYELRLEFNPRHLDGRRALSPLCHPCSQNISLTWPCSSRYYYRSSSIFLVWNTVVWAVDWIAVVWFVTVGATSLAHVQETCTRLAETTPRKNRHKERRRKEEAKVTSCFAFLVPAL